MPIFMFLCFIALGVWGYVKLKNSPKFDKFCKDLTNDDSPTDSTKSKIKDIVDTEKDLGKQVEQNTKQTEKINKETEDINKFLGDRNKTEKKEDS